MFTRDLLMLMFIAAVALLLAAMWLPGSAALLFVFLPCLVDCRCWGFCWLLLLVMLLMVSFFFTCFFCLCVMRRRTCSLSSSPAYPSPRNNYSPGAPLPRAF